MRYVKLGHTGLDVSAIALGCMTYGEPERGNHAWTQVALAWVSHNPVVSAPIIGARRAAHLEDAVASLDLELTDDELEQLESPYTPHDVAGF